MKPKNDRLIRALLREPVDSRPVWLMRQAGRYLPEYRKLRRHAPDFLSFCKTPELACEATLQPLSRFDLDGVIVFSDILTIPDAMGADLHFIEGKGPVIKNPIDSLEAIDRLKSVDVSTDLFYVMETIRLVSQSIGQQLPIIGFAGSPWTVASYWIEGKGSRGFPAARRMVYERPEWVHALLNQLTRVTIAYLNAQILAGAQIIMLFDTWGGILAYKEYLEFSLAYMKQIADRIVRLVEGRRIPVIFFTKPVSAVLEVISSSGCDAVGIDSSLHMLNAKQRVAGRVALQGNIDPFLLFATPGRIREEVFSLLKSFGNDSGLVFNLGHGVDKDTPLEHVAAMIAAVREYA